MNASILWFRQDLRLDDNPALKAVVDSGQPVVFLYIHDESDGVRPLGGASKWFLHHALQSLSDRIDSRYGAKLVIRTGPALGVLEELCGEIKAKNLFYNRLYEPYHITRDKEIKARLREQGLDVESFNGSLLHEPWEIQNKQGSYFKVFTPYWKECNRDIAVREEFTIPRNCKIYADIVATQTLDDLKLYPANANWTDGFSPFWDVSEEGARKRLKWFLDEAVGNYKEGRDIPGIESTSKLSPYLHHGMISPVQIWHAVKSREPIDGMDKFLSEVGWREFAYHLLYHFPDLPKKPFNKRFEHFPWEETNQEYLRAWQRGMTGYPMVDAGMRELWQTGWMHNRVRMIVASFLCKHLLVHWHEGEEWFWDTLMDADLANNTASWQWVAGSGADASPYFRIFNPFGQGEKFDAEGDYVRRWVPEIAGLGNHVIHTPWEANEEELECAGIILGDTYPKPLVDHKTAREKALKSYKEIQ